MDIGKILDFKPDTELRGENPFERTEFERARKSHDEPERKRAKFVLPGLIEKLKEPPVKFWFINLNLNSNHRIQNI